MDSGDEDARAYRPLSQFSSVSWREELQLIKASMNGDVGDCTNGESEDDEGNEGLHLGWGGYLFGDAKYNR